VTAATRQGLITTFAVVGVIAACTGAPGDPGLDLPMRVRNAQLVRAALPTPEGGPVITAIEVRAPRVYPGLGGIAAGGRTAAGAYAVNLSIDRQQAYWIIRTGVEDTAAPGELLFQGTLDFSRALDAGPFWLQAQATDGEGRPGPVAQAPFEALPLYPAGELVVTLEWDADVDADLYVVEPSGITLGGKNVNTWNLPPPGGGLPPPDSYKDGGTLDLDSNGNCVIDGLKRENAVWKVPPLPGRYTVRVGLARGCGLTGTRFVVTVRRRDVVIGTAQGVLYESDALSYPTQLPQAPGIWVTEFDVQ
jgi:hypothetical protein